MLCRGCGQVFAKTWQHLLSHMSEYKCTRRILPALAHWGAKRRTCLRHGWAASGWNEKSKQRMQCNSPKRKLWTCFEKIGLQAMTNTGCFISSCLFCIMALAADMAELMDSLPKHTLAIAWECACPCACERPLPRSKRGRRKTSPVDWVACLLVALMHCTLSDFLFTPCLQRWPLPICCNAGKCDSS